MFEVAARFALERQPEDNLASDLQEYRRRQSFGVEVHKQVLPERHGLQAKVAVNPGPDKKHLARRERMRMRVSMKAKTGDCIQLADLLWVGRAFRADPQAHDRTQSLPAAHIGVPVQVSLMMFGDGSRAIHCGYPVARTEKSS